MTGTANTLSATTSADDSEGRLDGFWAGSFALTVCTAPGSSGPMSAPLGCVSAQEYLAAMRWRYTNSPAAKQQMWVIAHREGHPHSEPVPITGPFAPEARQILTAIRTHKTPAPTRLMR